MIVEWTQRDGAKIAICEMGDRHVQNAAAMVLRMAEAKRARLILDGLKVLSSVQGEMAVWSIERDIDRLESLVQLELVAEMFGEESEQYAVCTEAQQRYEGEAMFA